MLGNQVANTRKVTLAGEGRGVIVMNVVIEPVGLLEGFAKPDNLWTGMQTWPQDQKCNCGKNKRTEESQQHQLFTGVTVGLQRIRTRLAFWKGVEMRNDKSIGQNMNMPVYGRVIK